MPVPKKESITSNNVTFLLFVAAKSEYPFEYSQFFHNVVFFYLC